MSKIRQRVHRHLRLEHALHAKVLINARSIIQSLTSPNALPIPKTSKDKMVIFCFSRAVASRVMSGVVSIACVGPSI